MKNETVIEYFSGKYWYYLCRFVAWRQKMVYFHVTPAPNAKNHQVWREFYNHLTNKDKSYCQHSDWDENKDWEEQNRIQQEYKQRYSLTAEEVGYLHRGFSPLRVAPNLSLYLVKFYIEKGRLKN